MKKIYILQESATRDGLNFDYFCKSLDSLRKLVEKSFNERFDYDKDVTFISCTLYNEGQITVNYSEYGEVKIFTKYSYIEISVF